VIEEVYWLSVVCSNNSFLEMTGATVTTNVTGIFGVYEPYIVQLSADCKIIESVVDNAEDVLRVCVN